MLAILFPVLAVAKARAVTSVCESNIRQVALAIRQYADDYDEHLPSQDAWRVWSELHPDALHCPLVDVPKQTAADSIVLGIPGYGYNNYLALQSDHRQTQDESGIALSRVKFPASTVLLCDQNPMSVTSIAANECKVMRCDNYLLWHQGSQRHLGGGNYVFCDLHVKWYRPTQVYDESRSNPNPRPVDGSFPTFSPF